MRCFTFKSLKSLKAPGLDGFDIGLLNLHREKAGAGGGGGGAEERGSERCLTPRRPPRAHCDAHSGFCQHLPERTPKGGLKMPTGVLSNVSPKARSSPTTRKTEQEAGTWESQQPQQAAGVSAGISGYNGCQGVSEGINGYQ